MGNGRRITLGPSLAAQERANARNVARLLRGKAKAAGPAVRPAPSSRDVAMAVALLHSLREGLREALGGEPFVGLLDAAIALLDRDDRMHADERRACAADPAGYAAGILGNRRTG